MAFKAQNLKVWAGDRPPGPTLWHYRVPAEDTIADVQVAGYFDNARARRDKPAAGDVIIASKVVDGVAIGAMLFVSKGDEHVAFEVGKLS
mgnify:FL=1